MLPALFAGMNAMQGLSLALGAVQAFGAIQAGRAAAGTAEQQAEAMEIDGISAEAQAMENMVARQEDYENAMASNEAAFGLINRNPDDTVAFEDEEERVLMRDLRILRTKQELQQGKVKTAAMIEVNRGKNKQQAYFYQALGAGVESAISYKKYAT